MKTKQSELATNVPSKTSKKSRANRLILLISFFLVSILVGYFIRRKIQINAARQLVNNCSLNNNCFHIISALETLIQAQKNLRSFNFTNANLEDANLAKADFYRSNFSHANLSNANLAEANLYRANLYNANFANTNLKNANLTNANLKSAKNLTPTQIKSACNWEKAFFKGRFDNEYDEWIIDKQTNQQFIQQIQQDSDSDPEESVSCRKWKHWSQDK
ncbi:MAG: pentapeptide repeat-containing protein [Xenococcaceae cyanobacterium MO_188.B32]|nr:pentapeptide repeat-containing protein [Xenococcaceae cyanobacterium MO_188.B32]